MHADRGIQDEIDRSFGDGPRGVPVDELLSQGHRALARRRLLTGAGAALAVVAIYGTAAVAAGGSGTHASPSPGYAVRPSVSTTATGPSLSPSPALRTPSPREIDKALSSSLAEYDDNHRLVLDPRVTVVRRVDHLFPELPGRSVALELDFRGARYWYSIYQAPDLSGSGTCLWSGSYDGDFVAWVSQQAKHPPQMSVADPSPGGGPGDWPGIPDLDLVRFVGSTERLEPVAGVTILRQQAHVSVGDSFAAPDELTAAAKVETADGKRYYVIARHLRGNAPQYIAVTEADGGPTLADFLDFARRRYVDSGGGLL